MPTDAWKFDRALKARHFRATRLNLRDKQGAKVARFMKLLGAAFEIEAKPHLHRIWRSMRSMTDRRRPSAAGDEAFVLHEA